MALNALGVELIHEFSCDIDRHAKTTVMENFPPKIFFDNLMTRDNKAAPKVDLYVAGFPCQPFSSAGLQQGFKDVRGRGVVLFGICDYLEEQRPSAFVLENVSNLLRINQGKSFEQVMDTLRHIGKGAYNLQHKLLDTKRHGVPQSRQRVYIVGIRKDRDTGSFEFPEDLATRPSIEMFLEPRKSRPTDKDLPPVSQGTARRNVAKALKDIRDGGGDPLNDAWIVDCDSSTYRMKVTKDVCPCITRSRGGGHWITNRMRRMTKPEMMRLQGMEPAKFQQAVTDSQLGAQIGNAMSCNVLERLFVRLLPACRLRAASSLTDRWEKAFGKETTQAQAAKLFPLVTPGSAVLRKRSAAAPAKPAAKRARA